MCRILKALFVGCWFVTSVKTSYLDVDKRWAESGNRSRESAKQTVIIYNDYVPVEDRLDCVPSGYVVSMLRCNGVPQLPDRSDETNCSTQDGSRPGSFKCQNGKEIWDLWRCDGHYHCEDGSDETNCEDYDFRPPEGLFYLCNGVVECRGGWDEANCPPDYTPDPSVIPPSFTCSDEEGFPKLTVRFKCDEQKDCQDGSDEQNCEKMFRCKNKGKTLLPADDYCDGLTFCGSDQVKPSCILVNGPSNHILKNASHNVRSRFTNPDTEIYEYVIDEAPSSEETDSLAETSEELIKPNLQPTRPPRLQTTPNSHHKRLQQENTNPQPEQTTPNLLNTNPLQQSSNTIRQQLPTEFTSLIDHQLQEKNYVNPNDTYPRFEFATPRSEPTARENRTSPQYPPHHEYDENNNNSSDEDSSGNNNGDDIGNEENTNDNNNYDKNAIARPINATDKYNHSSDDGHRNNNNKDDNRSNSHGDDDNDGPSIDDEDDNDGTNLDDDDDDDDRNNNDNDDDNSMEGSGNNNNDDDKYRIANVNDNDVKYSLGTTLTAPHLHQHCVITLLVIFVTS